MSSYEVENLTDKQKEALTYPITTSIRSNYQIGS